MKQMLYTASLERHMDAYFQDVRLDDYNQQYQLAQMRIVREGELMMLSQSEIQYKLAQLKTAMETDLKQPALEEVVNNTVNTVDNIVENIVPVTIESKPSPTKKTVSPKSMIPGLAEAIANPKLKKTPAKQPKFKEKSPMAIQIEEAKGSPSSISAAKRRRASTRSTPGTPPLSEFPSPTSSEAPTESTSTTAQPSSPPKDKKMSPINFQKEKGALNSMIKILGANKQINTELRDKYLDDVKQFRSTSQVNSLRSKLMSEFNIDANPSEFTKKKNEIYATMDTGRMKGMMTSFPIKYGGLGNDVKNATSIDDLNKIIKKYHLQALGSGLKPKSKRKVSKRKV